MADELKQLTDSLTKAITMGKELDEVKKELNLSKTEKATIDRNLNLIKKETEELRESYAKELKDKKDELARYDKLIKEAQSKYASIASQNEGESSRLQTLSESLKSQKVNITRQFEDLAIREKSFSKIQIEVNNQISVIKEIIGLASKL